MPPIQFKPAYIFEGEAEIYKDMLSPIFDRLVSEIPQGIAPDQFVRTLERPQQNMLSMYVAFNEISNAVAQVQSMIPQDPTINSPQGAAWLAEAFAEIKRIDEKR